MTWQIVPKHHEQGPRELYSADIIEILSTQRLRAALERYDEMVKVTQPVWLKKP